MNLFSFIGLVILLLICIGLIVAVGCAALFFIVIIIGGILVLIDKCKTLK